ncbi:NADPH:quinone reductase [Asticcacaulis solisilvae]|nr:NADPH:quinone reductase [Asticcacaulis solisilvae]
MKAAWYTRKGNPKDVLQVGELPDPTPGPGELLVRVRASGVNPSDTKNRGGPSPMAYALVIPHQDGAGEVIGAGSPDLEHRIGQRVWFYEAQLGRPHGSAAEYVVLPAHQVQPLPDHVKFEEGACLGVPAMTAHRSVFADGSVTDQVVLVTGGAGAVGRYAIQFAKLGGARVIATVSRDAQARSAKAAGADLVLNRKTDDLVAGIRNFTGQARGVDRVIDVAFGANLDLVMQVLNPRGVIATYASDEKPEPAIPFWSLIMLDATIRFVLVYVMDRAAHQAAAEAINTALEGKQLTHEIAQTYRLDEIPDMHRAQESGATIGKLILQV